MDKLLQCAKTYKKLTKIKYNIIIGRKGKTVNITLIFEEINFHHLFGLHKLTDLNVSRQNRKKVFNDILNQKITQVYR